MKFKKSHILNVSLLIGLIFGMSSCDPDFASIGSDLIGDNNFEVNNILYPVTTYNQEIGPLRTNGLPAYLLGYNNDPVFGGYSASFVTQLTPDAYDPVFGENEVLDSVVLYIPYFSLATSTDEEGNSTYDIDSIFGDSPIRLSVFKNNYFLRDFDPDLEFNENLSYFSDKTTSDGNVIDEMDLEGELLYEDNMFLPSNEQHILTVIDTVAMDTIITQRLAPGIRVHLDNPNELWEALLFEKEGEPELSNESNFLDHFRGLYIKAEAAGLDGTMMMLNIIGNSTLTFYYTSEIEEPEELDSEGISEPGSYVLNFSNIQANFLEDNFIDIPGGNQMDGDEQLFLKGGQGSMAIINLFNGDEDGNSVELNDFKSQNWLINQAELTFYVDQSAVQGVEPDRVYLYDLKNNTALVDYFLDGSVSSTQINAKIDHLKPLVRVDDDPEGAGVKYRIEITEHINNLLIRDSTNVKLGLVVTTNVNTIDALEMKDEIGPLSRTVSGAVLSPRGTVLFGNNAPDPEMRVEFKVYYTEPEN